MAEVGALRADLTRQVLQEAKQFSKPDRVLLAIAEAPPAYLCRIELLLQTTFKGYLAPRTFLRLLQSIPSSPSSPARTPTGNPLGDLNVNSTTSSNSQAGSYLFVNVNHPHYVKGALKNRVDEDGVAWPARMAALVSQLDPANPNALGYGLSATFLLVSESGDQVLSVYKYLSCMNTKERRLVGYVVGGTENKPDMVHKIIKDFNDEEGDCEVLITTASHVTGQNYTCTNLIFVHITSLREFIGVVIKAPRFGDSDTATVLIDMTDDQERAFVQALVPWLRKEGVEIPEFMAVVEDTKDAEEKSNGGDA